MNSIHRILTLAALAATAAISQAQLFETDYLSHTQPFSLADDEVANIALNGAVSLYGTNYASLSLSTNGNVNFSGNNDFFSPSFPSAAAGAVIAPLWSDWFVDTLLASDYSRLFYNDNAQRFVATWDVRLVDDESISALFQVVLDKVNGDIKFGYGQINSGYQAFSGSNGNRTGLNAGDGVRFADNYQNFVSSNTQRIYTYNPANGNYSVVPEPASMIALSAGLVALARRRRAR